ncbi:MAG: NHL repeat-containing protein, partial [Planctomycetota bacterium]
DDLGNFRFPVAVTADDAGRLYVGEYGGNDRVQVFSAHPENKPLREFGSFGTGPGQFSRASGVAWVPPGADDKDAFVLVADAFGDRIERFTDQGEYRGALGGDAAVELHSPYDLARAADGTLWIPEYHGGRVTALRADGSLIGRWNGDDGEGTGAVGRLLTPWGLDVDADGRVWVADTGNRRLLTLIPKP